MAESQDRRIECADCDELFDFTSGEQEFYKSKDFSDPKRCKECRLKKKEQRNRK